MNVEMARSLAGEPDGEVEYKPIRILRLMLAIGEEGAPYNHFSLAAPPSQEITICTFFPTDDDVAPWIRLFSGDGSMSGFLRALSAALDSNRYDVAHVHAPHVGLLYLLVAARRGMRVPPVVFTVHNSYQNFRFRNRLMLLPLFARFDSIVCCSTASFRSMPRLHRRLAGGRLRSIPNGVDIERIDRVVKGSIPVRHDASFTVTCVSRLIDIKNPHTVVDAFSLAACDASRLVMIGIGELRDSLRARAAGIGPGNQVEFTGLIPRDAVYDRLARTNLFISASRGEGLPVAVLEAMACRRPVILSDITPHREIAVGVDFIPLVHPDDIDGFAREIRRFRDMSQRERAQIGDGCRQLVEQRFSLREMHRQYQETFQRVLDTRRTPQRPAPDSVDTAVVHGTSARG